jgi:hypothetical protein
MYPSLQATRNLIARHIHSPRGRETMASKMTPSLRRFRDYSAVGRLSALVEDVEDGALLASDSDNPHPDIQVGAPITADTIADCIAMIAQHGMRCVRIYINGRDYADFLKFDRDVLDPETQQALLRTGYLGKVYGCQVIQSRVVPAGTLYFCGEREYFARMPIRTELTVVSADMPWSRMVGFSAWEMIGFITYNFLSFQRALIMRN